MRRRVEIDFADPVGQMRDQPQQPGFDHPAAPSEPKDMIVGAKTGSPQSPAQHRVPSIVNRRPVALLGESPAQHRDRLRRDPYCLHTVVAADLDDQPADNRMEMHVLVGVHVIERQIGCAESFELRPDLANELTADAWEDGKSKAGASHVAIELAIIADELRDLHLGQHWMSLGQVQVQADTKLGQSVGAGYRIGRSRASDHQARGRQDAIAVCLFDGLVDRRVEPEIVGADDQPLQPAISRLRRNWKNSTPSRSRRRIICGLLTISATSEAIFLRRK